MSREDFKYVGCGIYTISEAARFTGVSWARVRHWIRGDLRSPHGERAPMPPIVDMKFGKIGGIYSLSFLDLIEILMVEEFRRQGVSVRSIRMAHERAKEVFNCSHPFALRKFWTDGRQILAQIGNQTLDAGLLNLRQNQYELPRVTQMFLRSIDTSETDLSLRWWPMERSKHVVLDPARNFGQPIVTDEGIPTIILANAVRAEGSIERAAEWYKVNPEAVSNAYDFETSYTRRLAA